MNQDVRCAMRRMWWLVAASPLVSAPAFGACPAGQAELLPNIRAVPPHDIAMADATNMKFSATSWNSGDGKLELVPRNPVTDPATGTTKQPVDQRIHCTGGSNYLRPAGNAAYHPTHNHVHYNDYANYILEPDTAGSVNPRKGTKTTFCIMDTSGVNTQLKGASAGAVFNWCPTQDPNFNTQGMSVGWGDTYTSNLSGQTISVANLVPGIYRLRHVFDPKDLLVEKNEADNESCRRVEIGDGANGRYVADRGPCTALPVPRMDSISPATVAANGCVTATILGANLAPELRFSFATGTGPLPNLKNVTFDVAGNYATGTLCVPAVKKGRKGGLGNDPVWDLRVTSNWGGYATVTKTNLLRVTN
ncbi:MAG TPA: lysyl oxidase family protein [Vicinamibacterales bacterium]|nr:lysyl oxidase family protein [Vicinamibacterales bacterium]